MVRSSITRENWREVARERHLTTAALALATGKSHRAVRSYMEGTRRPSDEWIARVASVIAAFDYAREEIA